jgi:hypothetical protein
MKTVKYLLMIFLVITIISCKKDKEVKDNIWTGPMKTFTKGNDVDWKLATNQDSITKNIIITRQNEGPIYNYKWWLKNKGSDATFDELYSDFWEDGENSFIETGGTKGIRWAILDTTGFGSNMNTNFKLFGKLGDTTNFYSFHNILSILKYLSSTVNVTSVVNNFEIMTSDSDSPRSSTNMPKIVGKTLGAYLVEDNIFIKVKFISWSVGDDGGKGGFSYMRSTED